MNNREFLLPSDISEGDMTIYSQETANQSFNECRIKETIYEINRHLCKFIYSLEISQIKRRH